MTVLCLCLQIDWRHRVLHKLEIVLVLIRSWLEVVGFTWLAAPFLLPCFSFLAASSSSVVTHQRLPASTHLMIAPPNSFLVFCSYPSTTPWLTWWILPVSSPDLRGYPLRTCSLTHLVVGSSNCFLASCGCPSRNSRLDPLGDGFCPLTSILHGYLSGTTYVLTQLGFFVVASLFPVVYPSRNINTSTQWRMVLNWPPCGLSASAD